MGRKLFASSMDALKKANFQTFHVWVLESNPAKNFYEKMGGIKAGQKVITIGDKNMGEIAYQWKSLS